MLEVQEMVTFHLVCFRLFFLKEIMCVRPHCSSLPSPPFPKHSPQFGVYYPLTHVRIWRENILLRQVSECCINSTIVRIWLPRVSHLYNGDGNRASLTVSSWGWLHQYLGQSLGHGRHQGRVLLLGLLLLFWDHSHTLCNLLFFSECYAFERTLLMVVTGSFI